MPRILKNTIRAASALLAVAIAAGVAFAALFHFGNSPPPPPIPFPKVDGVSVQEANGGSGVAVLFEVRRGESARSVGNRLRAAGLIRGTHFWNLLGRFRENHLRAGNYLIGVPSSQIAIRALLETGRDELVRVTVPEGRTIGQTALIMEAAGVTGADEFVAAASSREITESYSIPGDSMEGFLFPDTYLFPVGFPAARVVRAMADNFFARLASIDDGLASMPPDELFRLVVLASIVEKEYRVADEAAIMAGVFVNRLARDIRLESCATVVYVITEKLGRPHPSRIFYADLELPSPFNTYRVAGLPPSPIASPGLLALEAAFRPAKTDYLFFRLRDEAAGSHTFSKTLMEHDMAGGLFVRGW